MSEGKKLKLRSRERVQKIVYRGIDTLEKLTRDFRDGKVSTPQFWSTWDRWDEIGKSALGLLSPSDQQAVIKSRQVLNFVAFPQTPRPEKK